MSDWKSKQCGECGGSGRIDEETCEQCAGEGSLPVLTPEQRRNLVEKAEVTVEELAAGGLLTEQQSTCFFGIVMDEIREDEKRFEAWRENVREGLVYRLGLRPEEEYAGEPERLERILAGLEDRESDLSCLLYTTHDRRNVQTAAEAALSAPIKLVKCGRTVSEKERCVCGCCHTEDHGACPEFLEGGNGRCVYCDHGRDCHPGDPAKYNTLLGVETDGLPR